jgi:hypothetical protein
MTAEKENFGFVVDSDDVDHQSGYPDHSPQEPFSYLFSANVNLSFFS